jgi:hypothetical protein
MQQPNKDNFVEIAPDIAHLKQAGGLDFIPMTEQSRGQKQNGLEQRKKRLCGNTHNTKRNRQ